MPTQRALQTTTYTLPQVRQQPATLAQSPGSSIGSVQIAVTTLVSQPFVDRTETRRELLFYSDSFSGNSEEATLFLGYLCIQFHNPLFSPSLFGHRRAIGSIQFLSLLHSLLDSCLFLFFFSLRSQKRSKQRTARRQKSTNGRFKKKVPLWLFWDI